MDAYIIIKNSDGSSFTESSPISFVFRKDAYTPYTRLSAKLVGSSEQYLLASEIMLYVNDKLVHHGTADSVISTSSGGCSGVIISSQGFTAMLTQNQFTPGLISGISFNELIESFYTIPYVTHENNSEHLGYIFMNGKNTLWDSIANFTFKCNGHYPFISGTNCVRISPDDTPNEFVYEAGDLISTETVTSTKHLFSHFHMSDIDGSYGTYELADDDVLALNIVRHKFFELDMEYLYEPQKALIFRDKYASRGCKKLLCTYCGYNGEDLSDIISFGDLGSERICSVEIKGSSKGIFTKIGVYHDKFPH